MGSLKAECRVDSFSSGRISLDRIPSWIRHATFRIGTSLFHGSIVTLVDAENAVLSADSGTSVANGVTAVRSGRRPEPIIRGVGLSPLNVGAVLQALLVSRRRA